MKVGLFRPVSCPIMPPLIIENPPCYNFHPHLHKLPHCFAFSCLRSCSSDRHLSSGVEFFVFWYINEQILTSSSTWLHFEAHIFVFSHFSGTSPSLPPPLYDALIRVPSQIGGKVSSGSKYLYQNIFNRWGHPGNSRNLMFLQNYKYSPKTRYKINPIKPRPFFAYTESSFFFKCK